MSNIDTSKIKNVIALTGWHKANLQETYNTIPKEKFKLLPNGIDFIHNACSASAKRNSKQIIYTGGQDMGLAGAIDIFVNHLLPEDPELKFVVCRDVDISKLPKSLPESIKFIGKITHAQMCKELSGSGVWFYPLNKTETFCISAVEAQMFGCWCVYTNTSGLTETVASGHYPVTDKYMSDEYIKTCTSSILSATKRSEPPPDCDWIRNKFSWESAIPKIWINDIFEDKRITTL